MLCGCDGERRHVGGGFGVGKEGLTGSSRQVECSTRHVTCFTRTTPPAKAALFVTVSASPPSFPNGCSCYVSLWPSSLCICGHLKPLSRLLPIPVHPVTVEDDVDETPSQPSQSLITRNIIPPYGQRVGWKPSTPDDFGAWCVVCWV